MEPSQPNCIKALVVEFIATFLFVFAAVASAMTVDKLDGDALVGLFVMAVSHALLVAVLMSAGHVSGGHLNPAITLGLLVGGRITVLRAILYWMDQLVASASASYLIYYLSGARTIPIHKLASEVGHVEGVIWEILLTFSLLFTVYATMVDPKKEGIFGLGPVLVGFVIGANILAGGAFSGAAMNPGRAFGPALVSGNWTDHWVYWVGPLIGGTLAGFIYDRFFIGRSYFPLPTDEENKTLARRSLSFPPSYISAAHFIY